MNRLGKALRVIAASVVLILPLSSVSAQTAPKAASAAKPAAESAPTPQAIADAKSKGLVWVNTSTKVYHKDGQFYGNTKHGKFMTEDEATKAGYRDAKASPIGKKKTAAPAAAPAK